MQAGQQHDWGKWEERFAQFLDKETGHDPAHDRGHVLRVVANAKEALAYIETYQPPTLQKKWF